ncbi:MAG TPA: response regulator [Verrucomicrobiales bacterium]|nr:response regulator [Verrucomicrobiales bacterium]
MKSAKILIIEDDDLQYEIYEETLSDYQVNQVRTGTDALKQISILKPDLILLDHVLDQGELGLDFLPELKSLLPHVPIIVISGALEVHQEFQALQGPRRAHYCLTKPVDIHKLSETVKTALRDCGETEVIRQFESLEKSKRVDVQDLLSRSTDRLHRQTLIRKRLVNKSDRPNVSAFSRDFKVSRRTIVRDIQELIRRGEVDSDIFPGWSESNPS